MLKIVKISLIVCAATVGFSMPAQAGVEQALSNICNIVKADDKGELRKKIRTVQNNYSMKLRDYYTGISCDGQSLIRTAALSDAVQAGTLLVKKMPKSELASPEQDGKTLSAWLSEQGLEASPIASALKDRI